MKSALEIFKSVIKRCSGLAGEKRLINLNMPTPRVSKITDLGIQGISEICAPPFRVVVERVCRGITYGHRPGHRDLYRSLCQPLGPTPVIDQKMIPRTNSACDRRQARYIGPITKGPFRQVGKVDSFEVPTVVMNVVLTRHFTVGRNIYPGSLLVSQDLGDTPRQNILRILPHGGHGLIPPHGGICSIGAFSYGKPVW